MTPSYLECPNKVVGAANGVDYAFRELGDGAVPLVLLQHFRGNLDYWDPALIDALAVRRRVILFDNAGVGSSSGTTHLPRRRVRAQRVAIGTGSYRHSNF